MPPELDQILGCLYLRVADFKARARAFGFNTIGFEDDELITALALASRAVEAALGGRTFIPDSIFEQHRWNPRTRRISVNQPPVMTLESIEILYAPGARATLRTADVVVNNQENYLELASLALVEGVEVAFESLGLTEAIVEVRYKSFESVPAAVVTATGFGAAKFLQQAEANEMLPAGLKRSKVGSEDLSRGDTELELPLIAKQLLRPLQRIAIA